MRLPLPTRRSYRRWLATTFLGMFLGVSCVWGATILAQTSDAALFPLPDALRPNVTFWKRVFAVFDSNGGMLHDMADVGIVYEVWYNDLPYDSQSRQSIIDDARTRYRLALLNLADGKREGLSSDEERVLSLFKGKQYPEAFRVAASSMRFQGGMRSKFAQGLIRSWSYLQEIEPIFASMGLPLELTLLPHVESSFENRALSKVGAAGIWQIMPATGRRFLRVSGDVDERLNIRQATMAAASILRENYDMLGTWPLAITAYNHGPYGMKQAVATVGSTDFGLIVQRYRGPLFGFASQNFYAEFLAVIDIVKNYKQYFDDILFQEPPRLLTAAARGAHEESPLPVPMSRYDAIAPSEGMMSRHLPATPPHVAPPAPALAHTVLAQASPPPVVTPVETPPAKIPARIQTAAVEPVPPPVPTEALPPIIESGTFSTVRPAVETVTTARPLTGTAAPVVTASATPVEPQPLSAPTPSTFAAPVAPQPAVVEAQAVAPSTPSHEPPPAPQPVWSASAQPWPVTPPPAWATARESSYEPRAARVTPPPIASTPVPEPPGQTPAREIGREARSARATPPPVAPPPAPEPPQVPSKDYRVRSGDTLWNIAQRHNTTTATLATLNKLRQNAEVQAGQVLQVPAPLPASPPPAPPVVVAEKEKGLPKSAILAVLSAGKPWLSTAEAATAPPPAPPAPAAQAQAAGNTTQSVRLPEPDERFQVKGETIRVAAQEQLSQYAAWLDVPVQRLQALNRLPNGQTPAMGTPVRLDFAKVSANQFTQKRLQYQRSLEEDFLRRYRVGNVVTRKLKPGETLLSVSRQSPGVPLWLLQRYNTHLDANTPSPGSDLRIPQVTTRAS